MKWKEDDVVLCTVKKIEGTTVFLELEDGASGSMVLSEVSAGRIRNLRAFVSPNKKVVCKILKISGGHIELSLRRVTASERENVMEDYKKESSLVKMIKVIGEIPEKIIEKIKEEYSVGDFIDKAREELGLLEKFFSKEKAHKLFEIIAEKEGKAKVVTRKFVLRSLSGEGVDEIKSVLDLKKGEIHYLGNGKFSVSISGADFKEVNSEVENVMKEIEKRAKEKKMLFEIAKEKK